MSAFEGNWGFLFDREGAKAKLEARVRCDSEFRRRHVETSRSSTLPALCCSLIYSEAVRPLRQ